MRTPALPKAGRIADSGDVNRNLLIDQLVRETMVLIAHLATQGGARAPLSDVAERVFRGLVDELSAQRLSHKVIADMFGLALRTYYDRVRRASESLTMRGRSLWEALHEHVAAKGSATRGQILERFRNDDEAIVKAVLADLVASGLLARAGKGARATYMIVPSPDTADADTLTALVQVALFHRGHADAHAIADALAVGEDVARAALEALVSDGRAARTASGYEAASILIPANDPAGFEAAVLDNKLGPFAERVSANARRLCLPRAGTPTVTVVRGHEDLVLAADAFRVEDGVTDCPGGHALVPREPFLPGDRLRITLP